MTPSYQYAIKSNHAKPSAITMIDFYIFDVILFLGTLSSRGLDVVERKTPQEVLHEQNEEMSQDTEKVHKYAGKN